MNQKSIVQDQFSASSSGKKEEPYPELWLFIVTVIFSSRLYS